jgi:hypothetical protein
MTPECIHILPNGQKCRGTATRGHEFCRHHGPKPLGEAPAAPRPRQISRIARWSNLSRRLPWLDPADLPIEAYAILLALLEDGVAGISDREAGRLLRGIVRRHGSVPFLEPEFLEPDPVPDSSSAPAAPRARHLAVGSSIDDYMFALGEAGMKNPALLHPHLARPNLQQTGPGLPQTQPSPRQTQPSLLQMQRSTR